MTAFGAAFAQSPITIKGRVVLVDDPLPLIGAIVKLNVQDSVKLKQKGRVVETDKNGAFTLVSTDKKNTVNVSFFGYKTKVVPVPDPAAGKTVVDLGTIILDSDYGLIEEVQVTGKASMAKVLGDTIQYNATAFKTNPDATAEDLLKKLPGVTTDENGKPQSQGETINKVMVNGKEYFENDPAAALKNLPADAVENMQIFDSQTDDAKFSGFDDGERVRTINITLKKGVDNSIFGKAYVGGGLYAPNTQVTDRSARYATGIGLNIWRGDHQFTIIGQSNNVNNQGFTLNDISSGSGGRGRGGRGGTDVGGFTSNVRGGIQTSYMGGFNYNGVFSDKFKMNASYFYTGLNAVSKSTNKQTYLTTPRLYESSSMSDAYQNSHVFNMTAEWKPTTNNRITFRPSFSYSNNLGNSSSASTTYLNDKLNNTADNKYGTNLARLNGTGELWWMHAFGKTGNTLNIGGRISGYTDNGTRSQLSEYSSLKDKFSDELIYETIKQIGSVRGDGYSVMGSATYSQRLSTKSSLSANYMVNYDKSMSDNQGWNWDQFMQEYSLLDTVTTNYFTRNYTTQRAGLAYNYTLGKDFNFTARVDYQNSISNNNQISPSASNTSKTRYMFQSVLPGFNLKYSPDKGSNITLFYRTSSSFPSVTQLQDVLNMDNPLQVSKGNPNLEQSYSHSLSLRYSYANVAKNINFSIMGSGSITNNSIANHRRFLTQDTVINGTTIVSGAQFSDYVNLQGAKSVRLFSNFGFGLRSKESEINYMNINFSLRYNYRSSPSIQDYVKYISNSNEFSPGVRVTSNISENIDFTVSYQATVRLTQNGTGRFDRYFGHDLSGQFNIIFLKYFFVNANATWRNTFGSMPSYSNHYVPINAAVGVKFLKNRQAEFRLQCYDLLDQNRSVIESVADTYLQTTTSNILRQYFMLSFTYKPDTRKSGSRSTAPQSETYRPSGGRMPMGMGGVM